MTLFRFLALGGLFGLSLVPSCGPVETSQFTVESVFMENNDVWQLNRPIRFRFNHSIDPTTVNFGSVMLKPASQAILAFPVTGQFEVSGKELVFIPACPTDAENLNGGFIPGGYSYQLTLPTLQTGIGNTVMRDTSGRPLSTGLTRYFQTPLAEEPLFIDTKVGPPQVTSWTAPAGLNLFTESSPDADFKVVLDQPVDTTAGNLNTTNFYILFSEADLTFPIDSTNKLPGSWFVLDNCSPSGPSILFRATGPLPADRSFKLVMTTDFEDLAGEVNNLDFEYDDPRGLVPTELNDVFEASRDWKNLMALDEFQEDFGDTRGIDLDVNLRAPLAEFSDGEVAGSFNFPYGGEIDPTDDLTVGGGDAHILFTDGLVNYQDSTGKPFQFENGVLKVHDLTIEAGASLKGEGSNPLVIYATGTVRILGTLDASGNDSLSPASLSHPEIVEWGALGQCGGGDGGSASQETAIETLVAEAGRGPFGTALGGGGGGEGGVQQMQQVMEVYQINGGIFGEGAVAFNGLTWWNLTGGPINGTMENLIAAGGGGGAFALTTNEAIQWTDWSGSQNLFVEEAGGPAQYDDSGPDHVASRHSAVDLSTNSMFQGAEAGLRGGSHNSGSLLHLNNPAAPGPTPEETYNVTEAGGVYGMQDGGRDTAVDDLIDGWDPPSDGGAGPFFSSGSPTAGPDGGYRGVSVFLTPSLEDDYYGKRVAAADGAVVEGELASPWAGSGGGGGGDLSVVEREILDTDGDLLFDPTLDGMGGVMDYFPDPDFPAMSHFPYGWTRAYFKGAAGGGGGGQTMIFALGEIVIGADALLDVSGGCGAGGEHALFGYNQVSGSGGGSGGHLILHSNTGLDLSQIDIGDLNINQILNSRGNEAMHSLGGRRGWSATSLATWEADGDGNGDFMVGRGGAGANGIIQIHVPNPLTDILFHADIDDEIQTYMEEDAPTGYANTDNLELAMRAFCVPAPRVLIPFFDSASMFQSDWVDTSTSLLRLPTVNSVAGSPGDFPLWSDGLDGTFFDGIQIGDGTGEFDGRVVSDAGAEVQSLPDIARASLGVSLTSFGVTVTWASRYFDDELFLLNPSLLVGFDFRPHTSIPGSRRYQIAAASWDAFHDILTLTIEAEDGPIIGAGQPSVTWAIFPKFFRVDTAEIKDTLPSSGFVRFEFQGADEVGRDILSNPIVEWAGVNIPNEDGATAWTSDLSALKGKRYFRYRVTFDVAEQGSLNVATPLPVLKYLNVPFGW